MNSLPTMPPPWPVPRRHLANDKNVTAIACFTMQGQTAWLISKIRPCVPIMAFTPTLETWRRLAFLWGVNPHRVPFANSLEQMLGDVDSALMHIGSCAIRRASCVGLRLSCRRSSSAQYGIVAYRWRIIILLKKRPTQLQSIRRRRERAA